jgi:hypothetical protein
VPEPRAPGGGRIDPADYQARLDRIGELLTSMIDRVGELSTQRCPYKNRVDQCTAQFGCRNQRRPDVAGELKVCGGDDRLDYRSAWETA